MGSAVRMKWRDRKTASTNGQPIFLRPRTGETLKTVRMLDPGVNASYPPNPVVSPDGRWLLASTRLPDSPPVWDSRWPDWARAGCTNRADRNFACRRRSAQSPPAGMARAIAAALAPDRPHSPGMCGGAAGDALGMATLA
jgi:hypothetical protein